MLWLACVVGAWLAPAIEPVNGSCDRPPAGAAALYTGDVARVSSPADPGLGAGDLVIAVAPLGASLVSPVAGDRECAGTLFATLGAHMNYTITARDPVEVFWAVLPKDNLASVVVHHGRADVPFTQLGASLVFSDVAPLATPDGECTVGRVSDLGGAALRLYITAVELRSTADACRLMFDVQPNINRISPADEHVTDWHTVLEDKCAKVTADSPSNGTAGLVIASWAGPVTVGTLVMSAATLGLCIAMISVACCCRCRTASGPASFSAQRELVL